MGIVSSISILIEDKFIDITELTIMDPIAILKDANAWLVGNLNQEVNSLLGTETQTELPACSGNRSNATQSMRHSSNLAEDGFPHLVSVQSSSTGPNQNEQDRDISAPKSVTPNYSPLRNASQRKWETETQDDWMMGDLAEDGFPLLAGTGIDRASGSLTNPVTETVSANVRPPRHPSVPVAKSSSAIAGAVTPNKKEEEEFVVSRKKTVVEREFQRRQSAAKGYIDQLPPEISIQQYLPTGLQGALFCGHLVTDLDSIAGSIGAAELYGGIAARASEINPETSFVLDLWGVDAPRPIEDLLIEHPDAGVCLVDHQQMSQLNKAIDVSRIVGVIDHHALQNATIITEMPIYIDIRPWGSMSSIITHIFMTLRRRPRKETAGVMLCAILSDTLNLQSPTTTEWDRLMVAVLVQLAEIDDVQSLASQQFKAKSNELADLSPETLITGDQKVFTYKTPDFDGSIAFAVVETTDDDILLSKKQSLVEALREDKEEKGYSLTFLAIVNIVDLHSTLLLSGPNERSLAAQAFANGQLIVENYKESTVMDLGSLVSRKKDFVPAISNAIKKGWSNAPRGSIHASPSDIFDFAKYRDTSLTMNKVH